jgi:hypothetical protein
MPVKRYTPAASVVSRDAHDRCTVPNCLRRPMSWGGAYCTKHHHRHFENGHVEATVATIAELARFTDWIDQGLRLYRDTPAVRIGLVRAEQLLKFTPQQGHAYESYLSGRMAAVRAKAGRPVNARKLLITILSFFAFEAAEPARVMNTDVRNIGLARSVIRLGRCKQRQPRKTDLIPSGAYIASQFAVFAGAFLNELKRRTRADNIKRQREDAALGDFTIPNDEPEGTLTPTELT